MLLVFPLINSFDYILLIVACFCILIIGILIQKVKNKQQMPTTTEDSNELTECGYKQSNFGIPGQIRAVKTYDRKGTYVNSFNETQKLETDTNTLDTVVKDDLKQIKGIGPNVEKKFNDCGYYTFKQLVLLKKSDDNEKSQLSSILPQQVTIDDICNQAMFYYKKQQVSV